MHALCLGALMALAGGQEFNVDWSLLDRPPATVAVDWSKLDAPAHRLPPAGGRPAESPKPVPMPTPAIEQPPVGFERVRVCGPDGCRYEWRPMQQPVAIPANVPVEPSPIYVPQRRGFFFGRRR